MDEAARTVTGVIANEAPDLSGEIFDYERSKPNFEKWSTEIAKATDGKNLGNVRAMHSNISAGITKAMDFDDLEKQISVVAEITDDNEWRKVLKGNYTGFSIGGAYGDKWPDPALGKTRYEAKPNEYSLVDLPCNPSAQFSVIKVDGSQEMRKFETTLDNAEALAKWAEGLTDTERAAVLAKIAPAAADPVEPAAVTKDYTAQAARLAKVDGSADTGNVIRVLLGKDVIEKGLWSVAEFAETLNDLSWIADCADDEAAWEKDGSKVPAQLRAALKPLADAFLAMAAEEVAEAIAPAGEVVEVLELAAPAGDLAKAADDLAKAADALQKMTTERDDLAGRLAKVTTEYTALLQKAAPPKGVVKAVPVGKDEDAGNNLSKLDDAPVLRKDGSVDHFATADKLMKIAHRR
ncbi:hypothetical protein RHOFW104T7_13120 [Rhodanobacter thiooxydans]|uniref:Phage-like element PBSX protein XkdF domain-containing protein n=1 Tax=Rhodanobacter thiooxydans TaxID=416169 RepID=A0A154QHA5_9GAMM|nr:hypothetical protein RHOFW104T7_13120 [Rhodanobacter thiooxydans]